MNLMEQLMMKFRLCWTTEEQGMGFWRWLKSRVFPKKEVEILQWTGNNLREVIEFTGQIPEQRRNILRLLHGVIVEEGDWIVKRGVGSDGLPVICSMEGDEDEVLEACS